MSNIILPVTRASLAESCQKIAAELDPALIQIYGTRIGYVTVLFPMGALTDFAWVSNVETRGMIQMLEELLRSLKARGSMAGGLIV